MGKLIAYSGMQTKIRAMKKNLLSDDQYKKIARFRSVADLVSYLQTLPAYSASLSDLQPEDAHRSDVELRMKFSARHDFSKLYHFAGKDQKTYMHFFRLRYEADFLKACLRKVLDSREQDISAPVIDQSIYRHTKIDFESLSKAENIEEFIDLTEGSIYESSLKSVANLENPTLFDYETAIDIKYFSYMWESRKILVPKGEEELFDELFGSNVDLLNMLWIYRCKKYYNIAASAVYSLLIPINYKVSAKEIRQMVDAENIDEVFHLIKQTFYGTLYEFVENEPMEHQFGEIIHRIYSELAKKNPYSLASINAYFQLKNLETARVVTAMECIRYGYSSDTITNYINSKRGIL